LWLSSSPLLPSGSVLLGGIGGLLMDYGSKSWYGEGGGGLMISIAVWSAMGWVRRWWGGCGCGGAGGAAGKKYDWG
jgi:hypothetical protein